MLKKIKLFIFINSQLKQLNMKNWKTTVSGIMTALGVYITDSPNPQLHLLGMILVGGGTLLLGLSAKDKNVTGGTVDQTKK